MLPARFRVIGGFPLYKPRAALPSPTGICFALKSRWEGREEVAFLSAMQLNTLDFLTPSAGFVPRASWFDAAVSTAAILVVSLFTMYLARCYLQEFRRERRILRRKARCRAAFRSDSFEPSAALTHGVPPHQTDEPVHVPLGKLDCWRLQWIIPEHDRVTMVWNTREMETPSQELYVPLEGVQLKPQISTETAA